MDYKDQLVKIVAALKVERDKLDAAIRSLEIVIGDSRVEASAPPIALPYISAPKKQSYVDVAHGVLAEYKQPLHAEELARRIGLVLRRDVARPAVETAMIRDISKLGPESKFVKTAPSTYGLRVWQQAPLDRFISA
jgi:hypothetical protein